MTSNLKLILSAVTVAALAASPAMANSQVRANHFAPADARASAATPYVTPYGAGLPEHAHEMPGQAPDFQLGGEK
jgi:hypothetical protein